VTETDPQPRLLPDSKVSNRPAENTTLSGVIAITRMISPIRTHRASLIFIER
jgi:hypothetical protein